MNIKIVALALLIGIGGYAAFRLVSFRDSSQFSLYTEQVSKVAGVEACKATSAPSNLSLNDAFAVGVVPFEDLKDPRALAVLEELGIKWVRFDFIWQDVEPSPGNFRWGEDGSWPHYDEIVTELAKRNIQIQAIISGAPGWAKDQDWDYFSKEAANFAEALVNRYKPGGTLATENGWNTYGIRYWEIFNEPNFPCCGWLEQDMGGKEAEQFIEEYVQTLASMNASIRKANPRAVILLGGLSDQPNSEWAFPADAFLREVYQLGAKRCFDVVAVHPYEQLGRFAEARNHLRGIMAEFGDGSKPIWFNEFGINNESIQEETLVRAMEERRAVPFFAWFSLKDFGDDERYGLLRGDFSKKPIYYRLKEILR